MIRVTIEENGRSRTMTAQEVIIRNLVNAAARRDVRAIHALFALKERYQDSSDTTLDPAELRPEDQEIIEGYLATLRPDGPDASQSSTDGSKQDAMDGNPRSNRDGTEGGVS
jgi:hypothetical protein